MCCKIRQCRGPRTLYRDFPAAELTSMAVKRRVLLLAVTFGLVPVAAGQPLSLACSAGICTAAGGAPPYSFGLTAPDSLPAGLTFGQTGANVATIRGVPAKAGSYHFDVSVRDSTGTVFWCRQLFLPQDPTPNFLISSSPEKSGLISPTRFWKNMLRCLNSSACSSSIKDGFDSMKSWAVQASSQILWA